MKHLKLHAPSVIIVILVAMTVIAATKAEAGQYFNPQTGEYVTVKTHNDFNHRNDPIPEYETKYNQHNGEWTVEREDAEIEYNPYNGEYEYQK